MPKVGDDTGSLPLAMLLTLVGAILCGILAPIAVRSITSTRQRGQRAQALHAAQTGLQVMLGQIRAAADQQGHGVVRNLPCVTLRGAVTAGSRPRYQVSIDYLRLDPQGHDDTWITANRITCTPGSGPASIPDYAVLTAIGTDQANSAAKIRRLRATYIFSRTGQRAVGGQIHAYRTGGADLCLDAGSATPAAGTTLTLRTCDSTAPGQSFWYGTNLTLLLPATRTTAQPLGLCVEPSANAAPGVTAQLRNCAPITQPQQQWLLNDQSNLEGTTDGTLPNGYCLNAQTPTVAGSIVILGAAASGTCRSGPDPRQTFTLDRSTGTGAAGPAANQLINLKQSIRCITVANADPKTKYLVLAPCQQTPDPLRITWNQRWSLPATQSGTTGVAGLITTDPGTGTQCLQTPGRPGNGQYVTLQSCNGTGSGQPPHLVWTVFGDTGTYQTSYQIQDHSGYCLAPTDPAANPPDLHPGGWQISKLTIATCDGSEAQKWNPPSSLTQTTALHNLHEL